MREIKFRAWVNDDDPKFSRMITSDRGVMTALQNVYGGRGLAFSAGFSNIDNQPKPDKYELMQFTELTDKNGKEIYEGDILRLWRSVGRKGQLRGEYLKPLPVIYQPLWCQFVADDKENKMLYRIWQEFGAFEVIGNIYENPELLGGDS